MLETLAPERPKAENSVDAVSWDHTVLYPVAVMVVDELTLTDVGVIDIDGAFTCIDVLLVPSDIVRVPVPEPVDITMVAEVVEVTCCDTRVAPETPLIENGDPDHDVPDPVRVIVMFPE